jgi:hypothetical protein
MWITVLGLAIAVNFEPIRLGLITLTLGRPRPALQLLAFLCGSFLMSVTAGLVVLFIARPGVLIVPEFGTAKVQLAFGVMVMVAAAVLASNVPLRQFYRRSDDASAAGIVTGSPDQSRSARMILTRAKGLARGSSPWLSGAMGLTLALPSVDYLALLVLIATSGAPPLTQLGLLVTFLAVANTIVAIPIASLLVAPTATRARLESVRSWVLARSRRDVALLLALAGGALLVLGMTGR